jgi:hypothetical protein
MTNKLGHTNLKYLVRFIITLSKQGNAEQIMLDQLKEYMVNPFLGAVKRPFKWATGSAPVEDAARLRIEAQRELQNATRELSKQHQKHQELKLQSERLKAEIKDYEHKEKKLVN